MTIQELMFEETPVMPVMPERAKGPVVEIPYETTVIQLTRKPWGCICGFSKHSNTLYIHH